MGRAPAIRCPYCECRAWAATADGWECGCGAIMRDVTGERRAERKQKADRLREKWAPVEHAILDGDMSSVFLNERGRATNRETGEELPGYLKNLLHHMRKGLGRFLIENRGWT